MKRHCILIFLVCLIVWSVVICSIFLCLIPKTCYIKVDNFIPDSDKWDKHGTSPYLTYPDYPASYLSTTDHYGIEGNYTFENIKKNVKILNVTLEVHARISMPWIHGYVQAKVYINESDTYIGRIFALQHGRGEWKWFKDDLYRQGLDTIEELNFANFVIKSKNIQKCLMEIDCIRLKVEYR